jgi:hypothetical protein
MEELRSLILQYSPYHDMYDDAQGWRRGASIDHRIRALVKRLRIEGHGPEIDTLMAEHPSLISCPGGANALA